jgi:hypothetical protein
MNTGNKRNTSNTSNTGNIENTGNTTYNTDNSTNTRNSSNSFTNRMSSRISNTVGRVRDSIHNFSESIKDKFEDKTGIEIPDADDDSIIWTIIRTIIFILLFIVILWIVEYLYVNYETGIINSPMLLNGTKNAKQGLVISQNPKNTNYIPITPSEGADGVEFSYSFWMEINDFTYKSGQWKHVFHKGNSSSYPNRAPGVWIHPNSNAIRIYMNTQDQILEYVDIDNIPTRKWLHVVIVLRNKILDVYVNGYLKVRKELSSIPRQNNGDFWLNMFGGFEGFLSNIQYFNSAVSFNTIQNLLSSGPSSVSCMDNGDTPPYLDNSWWFTNKSK